MATVATVVALPVLVHGLVARRSNDAPVAAVPGGADLAHSLRNAASSNPARTPVPEQRSQLPLAPVPTQPPVLDIAVPASTSPSTATGTAVYRRFSTGPRTRAACATPVLPVGTEVKVTDVDNGHELRCVVVSNDPPAQGELIAIDASAFLALADPLDSPIPVTIDW